MPKPIRTRHELEQLIVSAVRQRPDCDGFQSIALHPVVGPSARGKFNWAPGVCDYGEASPASCEAALREIIPRFQQRYDLAPG